MSRRGLLTAVLAQAWQRAVAEGRRAGASAWRRWAVVLLCGYATAGLVVVLTVSVGRRWIDAGLQGWDESLLRALADSPFSFAAGLWFEAWGSSAFLVPLIAIAMVLLARRGYVFRAVTLLVAYLSIKGLVLGAWQLWDRARPEMIADGIAAPGLHSYPSGHAVNSVVIFGLLGAWWWQRSGSAFERALAMVAVTAVVALTCLGRVRLGTHWPSDIVAGVVIALPWLAALIIAAAVAERSAGPGGAQR